MIVFRTDVADTSDNKEAKISGWKEWEDRAVSFLKIYPNLTVTEDKKTKEPIRYYIYSKVQISKLSFFITV